MVKLNPEVIIPGMASSYSYFIYLLQGPPYLSVQSKLSLTDRNMHAKKFLKVGLKSWDWGIFGTTTSFYEMHTAHPLLDQMSVTFKNEFSLFVQILYNFSFDLLGMTDCLIMTTLCLVFEVPLQVFDTHLKILVIASKLTFQMCNKNLKNYSKTK